MVRIRLARRGRKKRPIYDVIVADARSPRDGRFIEKLGQYNPNTNPASIDINDDKALQWLLNGAQPSDTVRAMLSYRGVLLRKHLQVGVNKGAITQEEADKRFEDWKAEKDAKILGKIEQLGQKASDEAKARMEAEAKVKEARAEAIAKRKAEEEAKLKAEIAEAAAEGTEGESNEEAASEGGE